MDERIEVITIDRLPNVGGKARREVGQWTGSRIHFPVDVRRGLTALRQSVSRNRPLKFIGHFLEMVVAMMVGMVPLGLIYMTLEAAIPILEEPAVIILLMDTFMTVPMVAWMWHRGHTWRQAAEMSASMLVPGTTFLALGMWGPGHIAMVLGMLGLMLYRRDEYLDGRCHGQCQIDGDRA